MQISHHDIISQNQANRSIRRHGSGDKGMLEGADLAGDAVEDLVEEEHEGKGDVLVEGVLDQPLQPVVRQRPMHQQQPR